MSLASLSPASFAAAWGAGHLVRLPPGDPAQPQIPSGAYEFLTVAGLPRKVLFQGLDQKWATAFTSLSRGLIPILEDLECLQDSDTVWTPEGPPEGDWENYWLLGEEDFDVGIAGLYLHGSTGHVLRIDIELPEPISLLNTSVARLAQSLLLLREWSERCARTSEAWPGELERLADLLRECDPEAMEPGTSWELAMGMLREEGERVRNFRVLAG